MIRPGDLLAALRVPPEARSLKQKVIVSSSLSISSFTVLAVLRLLSTIVLTRLLAPEIFGVFAVMIMFLFILTMFSDLGIRSLILTRENEVDQNFLRNCWTVQLVRGLVVGLLLLLLSLTMMSLQLLDAFPPDSSYADPILPHAIAVTSIGFLILSAEFPTRFVYEREMKFGTVTIAEIALATISFLATTGLAFILRNIWALVLGYIVSASVQVALSKFLFRGPSMRLAWDRGIVSVIIERGKWIVGHSALSAVTNMADRLLLGGFMSATDFGFYHIARQIVDMPTMLLSRIHSQIGLQVFTEFHAEGNQESFRQKYYRYRFIFDSVAMTCCGILVVIAPTLVGILYDDRYAGVAIMLQILALGLPLGGFLILREAFSAQRRFREMTVLSLIQTATVCIGLYLALPVFGSVPGALLVVALHRIPEILVLLIKGRIEGWIDPLKELRNLPFLIVGLALGWLMVAVIKQVSAV